MNTNILHLSRALGLGLLLATGTPAARADDKMAANDKTWSGSITSVDSKEKVVKVHGFLSSKTFVLGENCSLALADKRAATLADFRPGQKVNISYQDAGGVLVAGRILQQPLFVTGEVSVINTGARTLTVRTGGSSKSFQLPENCNVILNENAHGTLADVKIGSHVTVIYETPNGQWTARQIAQTSQRFTGSLDAVNLPDRTVSAGKKLIGDKKFHLANDCAIVINDRLKGRLQDLRLGQNYELSYNTVDGVNIVNRIALVPVPGPSETARQSADLNKLVPSY